MAEFEQIFQMVTTGTNIVTVEARLASAKNHL